MTDDIVRQLTGLQRDVDGLIKPEVSRWMNWTPTLTQGVAVTITVNYARYVIIGQTVVMMIRISCTSAGTAGNFISIGGQAAIIQPANASGVTVIGSGIINDDSAGTNYQGALIAFGATDWRFIINLATNYFGINPAVTLASPDAISFVASYERI